MKTPTPVGMLEFLSKKGCLNVFCRLDVVLLKCREHAAAQVVSPISHRAEVLPAHVSLHFSTQLHKHLIFSKVQQLQEKSVSLQVFLWYSFLYRSRSTFPSIVRLVLHKP